MPSAHLPLRLGAIFWRMAQTTVLQFSFALELYASVMRRVLPTAPESNSTVHRSWGMGRSQLPDQLHRIPQLFHMGVFKS